MELNVFKNYEKYRYVKGGYLVRTSASRPGVPGSNLIAAPKSYEVYPGLGIPHLKIADLETLSHS